MAKYERRTGQTAWNTWSHGTLAAPQRAGATEESVSKTTSAKSPISSAASLRQSSLNMEKKSWIIF